MFQRIAVTFFALAFAGCAASNAPAPQMAAPAAASNTPAKALAAAPAATPSPAATPAAPLQTIPAGARFTIFCGSYNGADHVKFATDLKTLLTKNTKLKDWYVIHQAGQSSLYHGYYAEIDANAAGNDKALKRDAERSKHDLDLVQSIPNPQALDHRMFPGSLILPLDAPDPDAPPAWNLTNAQGFWTVQVAAFTGADRKRQTVEAVRQARASNPPVQAYYYHGDNVSSVCVGSWDRSALKEQDVARPGEMGTDPGARDNDKPFIANYSPQPLKGEQLGPDGKPIRVLQANIEVLDKTLLDTLKAYPEQAVDGYSVMLKGTDKDGKTVLRPRPSMIVMIPRADPNATAAGTQTNEPAPTLINPNGPSTDLGSRLRGIGQ